jgi:sugar/nucleoside kinase (ribokinase family)
LLDALADEVADLAPHIRIIVSAGTAGAWAYHAGRWAHCPAAEIEVANTAGAGDALLGGVIAGLAAGLELVGAGAARKTLSQRPLETALDLAVLLAAYTVTSPHTIHPGADMGSLTAFAENLGIELSAKITDRIAPD